MVETIKLEALEIEFPTPDKFVFRNEGYLESYDFYNRVCNIKNGRDLRMLEITNLNLDFTPEFGGFEGYIKQEGTEKIWYVHIYVTKEIETKYPLNNFVKAHEETHILQPNVLNRYDLLKQQLISSGLNNPTFEGLEEEQIAHVGGLFNLYRNKILIGQEADKNWQALLKQAPDMTKSSNFQISLEWFLRSKG